MSESARAITEDLLRRLYIKNEAFEVSNKLQMLEKDEEGLRLWAGARQRRMMSCMYAIAFLCLLRVDGLHIMHHYLEMNDEETGKICLKLRFRKTNQNGSKSFFSKASLSIHVGWNFTMPVHS